MTLSATMRAFQIAGLFASLQPFAFGQVRDINKGIHDSTAAVRIGETTISVDSIRARARVLASSPISENDTDVEAVHRRALRQAIRETVLLKAADRDEITVSDEELTRGILAMQQAAALSDDPEARNVFAKAAERFGINPDQFATDPRVLATYRQVWKLGAMRTRLANQLTPEQRQSPQEVDKVIEDFVRNWNEPLLILPAGQKLTGEVK